MRGSPAISRPACVSRMARVPPVLHGQAPTDDRVGRLPRETPAPVCRDLPALKLGLYKHICAVRVDGSARDVLDLSVRDHECGLHHF